ncbi:MAG: glycosyltransferase family 4 protein [Bryobacterales bacterium]|nr:glycosyltransferase family 4 protein [Bryobacterales bacterium]
MQNRDHAGVDARLYCFEQPDASERHFVTYCGRLGIAVHLVPWGRRKRVVAAVSELSRIVRQSWPCIIHTHDFRADLVAWLVARRTGVPVIASNHAWHGMWKDIGWKEHAIEWIRERLLRDFRFVVDVSEATRRETIKRGVAPERSMTLYTGVNSPGGSVDREEVRRSMGIGADVTVVGNIARLYPEKGQAHLIEAIARIAHQRPNVQFFIIGDGPLKEELAAKAASAGVGDSLRFLGFQHDLQRAMAMLDIFVHPSMMEGLPIVIYNAMTMNVPVIATDVAGVAEVITDGETALLVKAGDVEGLANAMLRLIDDVSLRARLRTAAAERIRSNGSFSARNSAIEFARLYRESLVEAG